MEHQAFLATIAEVAVAFTGFTGIVAVFKSRSRDWALHHRTQFSTMLRAALSALFMSFIPYLLYQLLGDTALLWRVSAGLIVLIMCTNIYLSNFRGKILVGPTYLVLTITAIFVVMLNLVAVAGLIPADITVLVSLVWQLFVSAHNFIALIKSDPQSLEEDLQTTIAGESDFRN